MYHFHVRYISKATDGSTERVLQYITRTGRFKKRGDQVREVISLHMPKWAERVGARLYWKSADYGESRKRPLRLHDRICTTRAFVAGAAT